VAVRAVFSIKVHLSNKNIGNPNYVTELGKARGNIVLTRKIGYIKDMF